MFLVFVKLHMDLQVLFVAHSLVTVRDWAGEGLSIVVQVHMIIKAGLSGEFLATPFYLAHKRRLFIAFFIPKKAGERALT